MGGARTRCSYERYIAHGSGGIIAGYIAVRREAWSCAQHNLSELADFCVEI